MKSDRTPPTHPPRIAEVAEGVRRPLISVMIPVYNCAGYLREALESVLSQDLGPECMEIQVLDNCSTADDPEAVVRECGRGRVEFIRHPVNIGAIANFNDCVSRARGEWVHILHGDDTIRTGFYDRVAETISKNADVDAVACRIIYIDGDGAWLSLADMEASKPGLLDSKFLSRQLVNQKFQFSGVVVRRRTYEDLGAFRPELRHCTDWDMWNRIAVYRKIFYDPEPLACFRLHAGQDSSRVFMTGENVADERASIRLCCTYVGPDYAHRLYRDAMRQAGVRASWRARKLWAAGQHRGAAAQFKEALKTSLAPAVLVRLAYFLFRALEEMLFRSPSRYYLADDAWRARSGVQVKDPGPLEGVATER